MRILIVISGLGYGGAERQVILLSRELVRQGHAVLIYSLTSKVPRREEVGEDRVEIVIDRKRFRLDWGVISRLRRTIRTWRADIVHGFLYDGDIYSRLAGTGLGVPVLNSVRNDRFTPNPVQRLGYALTSRLKRGVIANSYAGARFAQAVQRLADADVHVVWNGIDLYEVEARVAASTAPALQLWPGAELRRVCVIGSIKPQKDHALALRVAHELHRRDPAWRFLFVGDETTAGSEHKARILALAKTLGTDAYVQFTGIRADAVEIVSSCDVALVTSHFEGFPNVVLEAMACSTPVASTEYSDVRHILPFDWQVSSSRDAAELADIVERCHAERERVATAQRRWVEDNATLERSAARLLEVYGHYAAMGSPPSSSTSGAADKPLRHQAGRRPL